MDTKKLPEQSSVSIEAISVPITIGFSYERDAQLGHAALVPMLGVPLGIDWALYCLAPAYIKNDDGSTELLAFALIRRSELASEGYENGH